MHTKAPWPADRCASHALDRRQKERRPAEGEIVLLLESPVPVEIRGRLVDVSPKGFRVIHEHAALCAGQEVIFLHAFEGGLAEVVWTRILGRCVETGFRKLETTTS